MPGGSHTSDVLIALAGESGAGKSTSAQMLQVMGFHLIELTKRLRGEAKALFGAPTRADIQRYARDVQGNNGNDHFARIALEDFGDETRGDIVLDGIRNPDELDYITSFTARTARAFWLLAVVTPAETRFARVKRRNREGDPTEYDHFREDDRRALGDGKSGFQTNAYLIERAHRRIENTGDTGDLEIALVETVAAVRGNG